jgi:hypothetical protein
MLFLSTIVTQGSGSIGGVTAARNRGGNYFRSRVSPVNPQTGAQEVVRRNLAAATTSWRTLSESQRGAWNAAADAITVPNRLGQQVRLTGQQWYVRLNSFRFLVGGAEINDPPSLGSTTLAVPASVVLDASAGSIVASLNASDPWAGSDEGRLAVFLSRQQSPGVSSTRQAFTFWDVENGDSVTPVNSLGITGGAPHPIIAGQAYFVRFRASDADGLLSTDVTVRVIAQA